MQNIFYYAVAVLAGVAVMIFVMSLVMRGEKATVDTTQIMRAKKQMFVAMQNIGRDFRNIGSGKEDMTTVFTAGYIDTLSCVYSESSDCKMQFYTRVDSTSPDTNLVRYQWHQSGTEYIDTDLSPGTDDLVETQRYTLERVVDGDTVFATDRVSLVRLKLLDTDGNTTTNPLEIRRIDVELKILVPQTATDEAMEEVRWKGSYRPVNLTRLDS